MRLAVEIADEIGPLAVRGEGDRARTLANGEAFDRANLDMVFVYEQIANAIGQRCARLVEIAVALTQPAAATGADVDDGTESHNGQILVAPAVVRDVRALFGVMLQAAIADGST